MVVSSFPSKFRSFDSAQSASERAQLGGPCAPGGPTAAGCHLPSHSFWSSWSCPPFLQNSAHLIVRKARPKELSLVGLVPRVALRQPAATCLHIRFGLHGRVLLSFKIPLI